MPAFDVVARLCLVSGVRMEWLATGEGEMKADTPKAAPHKGSQAARQPDAEMELGLLTVAMRIVEDVLRQFGIRHQVDSDQFAELVRITFRDLARGAAEDATRDALDRILSIARNPHND